MQRFFLFFVLILLVGACHHPRNTVVRMETDFGVIRLRLYDETPIHRDNFVKLVREGYYKGMLFHRVIHNFMIQAGDPSSKGARFGMLLGDKDNGYTLEAEIRPDYYHKRGALAAARESDEVNPERKSSGSHFYIVQGKVFSEQTLAQEVERVNNKRYTALFNRFKKQREGEIAKYQLVNDYENLMRVNEELSEATRRQFEDVKLKLSDEQRQVYSSIGGAPHLDGEYTVFGEVIEGLDVVDRIAALKVDENYRPERDAVILDVVIE